MKTLPILAFLAALVAALVLPIRFELAGSLVFVTGLGSILLADYGASPRSRRIAVRAAAVRRERSTFRLAA